MNLVLLEESDRIAGALFRIAGERARHVREVLRAEVGAEVRVGLLEGPLGLGRVHATGDHVELECAFDDAVPERPRTDLILAIPRPKSLVKALPEIASLGVDRLFLLRTWRVQQPYLGGKPLSPEVYRPLLKQGLMQARATREPRVEVEREFKPFIEDRAPGLPGLKLLAHPGAPRDIAELKLSKESRVVLAIGPEGGFIQYELDAFAKAGFEAVTMGPRPLRVETACVALLAQIDLLRRLSCGG